MEDISTTPLIPLAPDVQPATIRRDSGGICAALDTLLTLGPLENKANVRSTRGRKSGRGHPGGRRGLGRHVSGRRRGGRALRDAVAHTAGWRVQSVIEQRIKLEHDFTSSVLSERARLLSRAALESMKTQLQAGQLHHSRSSYVVLFCDELVCKCSLWTNERLVMTNSSLGTIDRADMYTFPAVFSFWKCSGFSVARTSELLQNLDYPVLLLSLGRYLSANLLA